MALIFYIGSVVTGIGTLIMAIFLTFAEEEANIHKFFGDKEVFICTAIAFVLMVIGFFTEYKGKGF